MIARAAAGLNAEDRRLLYERGRRALIAELQAVQPPLTRSTIMKERLAFEEDVQRVETEEKQRVHGSE
jgi:hypothetical protein